MKSRIILSVVCIVLSLAACSKSDLESDDSLISESALNEEEQFAKTLAVALKNNNELSSFIRSEAEKAFDGDNNFLVVPNSDQPSTKGGRSFRDMLKTSVPATKSSESTDIDVDYLLDNNIKSNSPLLQVYVMNEECYDKTESFKVVYIPEDFEEGVTMSVPCYNENGEKTMIPTNNECEDEAVLVVSRNERTVAVNKILLNGEETYKGATPIFKDEYYNYYLVNDLNNGSSLVQPSSIIDDILIPDEYKKVNATN